MAWPVFNNTTRGNVGDTYYRYDNGSLTSQQERYWGTELKSRQEQRQTSVNTPGWGASIRRQHYPPEHAYVHYRGYEHYDDLSVTSTFTPKTGNWEEVVKIYSPSSAWVNCSNSGYTWDFDPRQVAINRLLESLKQSKGNLLTSLAESGKTAAMVANTATRLATAFRSLKKLRLAECGEALGINFTSRYTKRFYFNAAQLRMKERHRKYKHIRHPSGRVSTDLQQFAANTWLELSYGWRPLLSDIHSQAENLARVLVKHEFVTRSGRASAKADKKTTWKVLDGNEGLWETSYTSIQTSRVTYVVRYRIQDGLLNTANTFGLLNPLEVAWEIVPFSFVVDWFLPIGNALSNLTATTGLIFHGGSESIIRTIQVQGKARSTGKRLDQGSQWKTLTIDGGGNGSLNADSKDRYILTDFPSVKFPSFKDPRSFARAASAIALLQSVFLGSAKYR